MINDAKFKSKCYECGEDIAPGEEIIFIYTKATFEQEHKRKIEKNEQKSTQRRCPSIV